MVDEARPRETDLGLVPESGAWYVVSARETRWVGTDDMWRGAWIEPEEEWPALGFRLTVLDPGKPMARYHGGASGRA